MKSKYSEILDQQIAEGAVDLRWMKRKLILLGALFLAILWPLLMGAATTDTTRLGYAFRVDRENGTGTINVTFAPDGAAEIRSVRIHWNEAVPSGNLTASFDSGTSTTYDTNLLTQDMTALTDFVFPTTDRYYYLDDGDEFELDQVNPTTTATWGAEIVWRLI